MEIYYKKMGTVTSTNDVAAELLKQHDLVAVTANFQTNGRGRNARTWLGNAGENVYCTIGIHHAPHEVPAAEVPIFQILGGLMSGAALRKVSSPEQCFRLKYPNDVMAKMPNGRFGKISGIIAEHSFMGDYCDTTIIGIGINVNQTQFSGVTHNEPTSLALLGEKLQPDEVAEVLVQTFVELYGNPYEAIFDIWRRELNFIGKDAKILGMEGEWEIVELHSNGQVTLRNKHDGHNIIIDNGDSIRYDLN